MSGGVSKALMQDHNLVPAFTTLGKSSDVIFVLFVPILVLSSSFFPHSGLLYTLRRG